LRPFVFVRAGAQRLIAPSPRGKSSDAATPDIMKFREQ
jgi:hypothetical protein